MSATIIDLHGRPQTTRQVELPPLVLTMGASREWLVALSQWIAGLSGILAAAEMLLAATIAPVWALPSPGHAAAGVLVAFSLGLTATVVIQLNTAARTMDRFVRSPCDLFLLDSIRAQGKAHELGATLLMPWLASHVVTLALLLG